METEIDTEKEERGEERRGEERDNKAVDILTHKLFLTSSWHTKRAGLKTGIQTRNHIWRGREQKGRRE